MIMYSPLLPTFLVDTNGMKGPNKIGHDVVNMVVRKATATGAYSLGGRRTSGGFVSDLLGCFPQDQQDRALFRTLDDIYY